MKNQGHETPEFRGQGVVYVMRPEPLGRKIMSVVMAGATLATVFLLGYIVGATSYNIY